MSLTKREVSHLYEQPCFHCKWSDIDPFDRGLRCCNSDSECCTDYCPEARCKHFEEANLCTNCKHSSSDGFSYHCDVEARDCVSYVFCGMRRHAKYFEEESDRIRIIKDSILEDIRNREKCPDCNGTGFRPDPHGVDLTDPFHLPIPCWTCKGHRFIKKKGKPDESKR